MDILLDVSSDLTSGIMMISVLDNMAKVENNKKNWTVRGICFCLLIFIWSWARQNVHARYGLLLILEVVVYYFYLFFQTRQRFASMVSMIFAADILNGLCSFITAGIIALILINAAEGSTCYQVVVLCGDLVIFLPLIVVFIVEKKYHITRVFQSKRACRGIIIVGLLFKFSRWGLQVCNHQSESPILYVICTIVGMGGLLGALWLYDWHCYEVERELLWKDNQKMTQKIHKEKEILPALVSTLERLKEGDNSEMLKDILDETHQLCIEQIQENNLESMQCKSYPSTGCHVLDERIRLYGIELAEKQINLDVFVNEPLNGFFKRQNIKELEYLRLIGDLVRNAVCAIQKKEEAKGNILLIMGYINETFQTEIYDDGMAFPVHILNEFGKRGNTEGGTGNGVSDMFEIIERYKATYKLVEYSNDTGYTKGISILWDEKNERILESDRYAQVSSRSILKNRLLST